MNETTIIRLTFGLCLFVIFGLALIYADVFGAW